MGGAKTYGELEVSLEGYYKSMDGLLSYKEGASFGAGAFQTNGSTWEDAVTQGEGKELRRRDADSEKEGPNFWMVGILR